MEIMGELDGLYRVGLALAIGLVIGIERGWHTRAEESGRRTAGIRTFTLVGLLAGISAELATSLGYAAPITAFAAVLILTVAGYIQEARRAEADIGLTTEIAILLTFLLGAYAVLGEPAIAASAAVVTVALLRLKPELHRFVAAIDRLELNGAIRLLIMSVVILPLLPNSGFGPGGAINPFELWWMVVLVAALSFAGYFAIKLAGPTRGPILGGLLGGLASSTAVTLSFSRLAARERDLAAPMALGIALACTVMFVRILAIAVVVNAELAARLALPLGAMAAVTLAGGLLAARSMHAPNKPLAMEIRDPADIPAALKFGALLFAVALLSHVLQRYFGEAGIYALALAAGLADVDAISLTLLRANADPALHAMAASAITLAAISNTLVKAGMATFIGGAALARRLVPSLGAAVAVGLAALFALR